jgi:SSS family transporter
MQPLHILLLISGYFTILFLISYLTGKDDSNETFFRAKKQSPWFIVAFGMIGATLSGVTFISVPGTVAVQKFGYMQMVFGYVVGTLIIAYVLLPIYYKHNVTSIYQYLHTRLGPKSHKIGAFFFLLSRTIGAAFRIFLVALAMQYLIFDEWNVPFIITVLFSILLIWVYTHRGGIKTIVWTDTLQTFFMLSAVVLAIYFINQKIGWSFSEFYTSDELKDFNQILFTDNFNNKAFFLKSFLGGIFITIAMTGVDQDMMQKNLTCRNLKDAQKNMISMIGLLVIVNFLFLLLGALLYIYANKFGLEVPIIDNIERTDLLFPMIAVKSGLGSPLAMVFILGIIAAAYSSADSALTSLTTSYCVDFLDIENKEKSIQKRLRKKVHIVVSVILVIVVVLFNSVLERDVITGLFTIASYTYGPLLGLFFFGIYTKHNVKENYVLLVCVLSVAISYFLNKHSVTLLNGYQFSFELLGLNGLMTFLGLWLIRKKKTSSQ